MELIEYIGDNMETASPTEALDKLTEEEIANGAIVADPKWGFRMMLEPKTGVTHPPIFTVDACEELRERYEIQPHDVIITTYPKCGTTWMQQIMKLLLHGSEIQGGPSMNARWFEWVASIKKQTNPVFIPMSVDEMLNLPVPTEDEGGLRGWQTHAPLHAVPWKGGLSQAAKVGAKLVIIARNPKDACVSKYHHAKRIPTLGFTGRWENFYPLYLADKIVYGSFWDWHRDWWNAKEEHPDTILWLFYEDMKKDLKKEISRLANFLSLERSEEEIEKITERCTFKTMKAEIDAKTGRTGSQSHYRKGEAGGWVDTFSEEQSNAFDERTEEMYKECTLRFECM